MREVVIGSRAIVRGAINDDRLISASNRCLQLLRYSLEVTN